LINSIMFIYLLFLSDLQRYTLLGIYTGIRIFFFRYIQFD